MTDADDSLASGSADGQTTGTEPSDEPSGPTVPSPDRSRAGTGRERANTGRSRPPVIDRQSLQWWARIAGASVLALIAVFAAFQAYGAAGDAVSVWISDAYEPLFTALYNVAVLGIAVAGLSWLLGSLE